MKSRKDIHQDPLNSTLMGSVKGAYQYFYDDPMTDSMLYGLTGHAFTINVTNGLGPCAPYVWDMTDFDKLCQQNLGLSIFNDKGVVSEGTNLADKKKATKQIKQILDDGDLVLLSSFEYQLITMYENEQFVTTKPWEVDEVVTKNLTFDTLDELLEFMSFFRIKTVPKGDMKEGIRAAIEYAIKQYEDPFSNPDSAMGIKAFDYWLEKLTEENAIWHGNWWTSMVWSESRHMASEFVLELKEYLDKHTVLDELSEKYKQSSALLMKIGDKEIPMDRTIPFIQELKVNELEIYSLLKEL